MNRAKPNNVYILDGKYYDGWRNIWQINFLGHILVLDLSNQYDPNIWKKLSHNNLVWLQTITGSNMLAWLKNTTIQWFNLQTNKIIELNLRNSSTLYQLINSNRNNHLKFISNQNEWILLWNSFNNKNWAILYKFKIYFNNETIVDQETIKFINCNGTIHLDDQCPDNLTAIAFPIFDVIFIKFNRIFMLIKGKNRIMSFSINGGQLYQMSKQNFIQIIRHTTSACK